MEYAVKAIQGVFGTKSLPGAANDKFKTFKELTV